MDKFDPQKLIELRKKNDLTQDELANRISVSRTLVTKWETGKCIPTSDTIVKLCPILGCGSGDLFEKDVKKTCFRSFKNKFTILLLVLSISFFTFGVCLSSMSWRFSKRLPSNDSIPGLSGYNMELMSWFVYGIFLVILGVAFGIASLIRHFVYVKRKKKQIESVE